MAYQHLLLLSVLALLLWTQGGVRADAWQQLHPAIHHLGVKNFPEWESFRDRSPEGRGLQLELPPLESSTHSTLLIFQDDVKESWPLRLNGHPIGKLTAIEQKQYTAFELRPEWLHADHNLLTIHAPLSIDDIEVGGIRWHPAPPDQALSECRVSVLVTDGTTSNPIPCRLTVTSLDDVLMPFIPAPDQTLAVREGVIYTGDGKADFMIPSGSYRIYASRGFEYGVSIKELHLEHGKDSTVEMAIQHEVDTHGWIACDTHIHTRTFSGHGDATLQETMLTIAGEGIELAIATDHNHHTDFRPAARAAGVHDHFTPVIGNEVTTQIGHFNAFPVDPNATLPDHKATHWTDLMQGIRSVPGVRVVVLNHPRNVHSQFSPMAPDLFDASTGHHIWKDAFTFDGMELVTSAALQTDLMRVYRDWFGLLNQGHRLVGVGSSDTHDVNRYILGQGRSYIHGDDRAPDRISIDQACDAFLAGKVLVSMGLWVNMLVEQRYAVGDTIHQLPAQFEVEVKVRGPSWVGADEVALYLNGRQVKRVVLHAGMGSPIEETIRLKLPRPNTPSYLVAIAQGPGVVKPFWNIPRPYQHSSRKHAPKVIGSTNPIWIDLKE